MIIIWYHNIFNDYCKNASLTICEKVYSLLLPIIYIRLEVGRLSNSVINLEKEIRKLLKKIVSKETNQIHSIRKSILSLRKEKQKLNNAERILVEI